MKTNINLNKGAMFGLDARIALAIFGALSVISGAALFSAIENTKVTVFHNKLVEIGKAWEQYMLDTGEDIAIHSDSYRFSSRLVSDSRPGWNGPYIDYKIKNAPFNYVLDYQSSAPVGTIYLFSLNDKNWSSWTTGGCAPTDNCFFWIAIGGLDDNHKKLVKLLDKKIDGTESDNTGNIRWDNGGGGIYLKYAPLQKK